MNGRTPGKSRDSETAARNGRENEDERMKPSGPLRDLEDRPYPSAATPSREAWYHADFCHAFAWVYEDGDKLRVCWGERTGSDLYLHSRTECDRCIEIRKDEHVARDGEFTMEKPPAEFSSHESFFHVLAEIGKFVPGLLDEGGDDD